MSALSLEQLVAGYGGRKILHGIDLVLEPGLHVVLGANGAGKTTLFRIGAGVIAPWQGRVRILGEDPWQAPEVKGQIGYLTHRPCLYSGLTVQENLLFWQAVAGGPRLQGDVERVISELELADIAAKRAGSLSRGQAQRVAVGRVLLGDPKLLFLDEPTTGLDPLAARELRALFKRLAGGNRTIVYSTHNLYEAEEMADDVILLRAGTIVDRGSVDALHRRHVGTRRMLFHVSGDAAAAFSRLGYAPSREGPYWVVQVAGKDETGRIVQALVEDGLLVLEVRNAENPLEALYEDVASGAGTRLDNHSEGEGA